MMEKFLFLIKKRKKFIFLDYASGTPINKKVFKKMKPFFCNLFYNPSAIYKEAILIKKAIYNARKNISKIIFSNQNEIFFIDGGTEANNLIIKGVIDFWKKNNTNTIPHIIVSKIEHSSIIETCKYLELNNIASVSYVSVNKHGYLNIKELKSLIKKNTILVSVGYVNGEIGVIQDIRAIAKVIRFFRKKNNLHTPYLHTDAIQAVNYCNINVQKLGVDFMTINASKIYGPKKIAAIYKRKLINISPAIFGGPQEFGLRAGTENTPYIIGLSEALKITEELKESEFYRLKKIQEYMESLLYKILDTKFIINGEGADRVPGIINISFFGLDHEEIVLRLDNLGIKVGVRSACTTNKDGSHVINSLRTENTDSIRFSFGRDTSKSDIKYVVNQLYKITTFMSNNLYN